jgi:hypothetical protein
MMKKAILLIVFMLSTSTSFAALLNFDDLAVGLYGNSLTYRSVTFTGAGLGVTDLNYDRGYGIEHSLSNKLTVFDNPSDLWIEFHEPVLNISFWLSGAYKTREIYAYDSNNIELVKFVQTYPMIGPLSPWGTSWDYYYDRQEAFINLEEYGIVKVLIKAVGYDGFSIDDLQYAPVPLPPSSLLFGTGLIGCFGYIKWKFKRN